MAIKYNTCIIGVGRIGFSLGFDKKREQPASHTMALKANKNINLCAACDTDLQALELWHKYNRKSNVYTDCDSLFAKETKRLKRKLDIVVIAVNESSHLQITLKAIEYEPKLIILEKPVALNVKDAQIIQNECKKHNVKILINHERRFALDYNFAKILLKKIGTIQSVTAKLYSGLRVYCEQEEQSGLYSLLHDGTHLVDIVHFLLSDTQKCELVQDNIFANYNLTGIVKDEKNMIRNVSAHYKTENGIPVEFIFSGQSKFFEFQIEILGTTGKIELGNGFFRFFQNKESKLYSGFKSLQKISYKQKWNGHLLKISKDKFCKKTGYFTFMVQNAVDYLNGKEKLKSTVEDGIQNLVVLEQIKNNLKKIM